MISIARKLRELRIQFNLSQDEVARMIGVTRRGYQRMESEEGQCGKPNQARLQQVVSICMFYGITLAELVGMEEPVRREPWGGVWYDDKGTRRHPAGWYWRRFSMTNQPRQGPFFSRQEAIENMKEVLHGNAQHTDDVHTGLREDHVGPGPGLGRPKDSDVGKRLPRNERPVHPWRKAVFGRGKGILS